MTPNERKLVVKALAPYRDAGLIGEETVSEITNIGTEKDGGVGKRPDLVTRQEAAEILKCTTQTLINYQKAGLLPAHKIAGKRLVRYRIEDVEALLSPDKKAV